MDAVVVNILVTAERGRVSVLVVVVVIGRSNVIILGVIESGSLTSLFGLSL
jgi:hypothetical protein